MMRIRFSKSCLPFTADLIVGLLAFLFAGCSSTSDGNEEAMGAQKRDLGEKLIAGLEQAGDNRTEIEAFLDAYPDGDQGTAAEFLVMNLPVSDLASMTAKDLKENMDYACKARLTMPWGKTPSFNMFLHYVLPHRVTQEASQPWRAAFYEHLAPLVKGLDNMTDAALAVNRWCAQRTRFVQTEFRDQSPLDTLKCGYGRCEELMCITICALRSVGIPARPCSTPWWVVNDNNHAWVEVWADGDWYYLGGCEGTDALNRTWFRGTTKRAGAVVSTMFGAPDPGFETGERVYRTLNKSALINSTAVYSATCRFDISVKDGDGNSVSECPVAVSVFNYGGLRPLIGNRTDATGRITIYTGMGEFFLSAGNDEGRAFTIAKALPEEVVTLELTLDNTAIPDPSFWLRYPTTAEADRMAALRENKAQERKVKNKLELRDPHPLKVYEKGSDEKMEARIEAMPDPEALRAILKDAGANWPQLVKALEILPEAHYPTMLEFLKRTSHLDRVELTTGMILDHVTFAEKYRAPGTSDETYYDHVLKPVIYLEHIDVWRSALSDHFGDYIGETREATVLAINEWIAGNIQRIESKDRLAPFMNPGQVLRSGWATDTEAAILAVGALRSLGIPARKTPHRAMAEYLLDENWVSFDPLSPKDSDENKEGEVVADEPEQADAYMRLKLTKDGKPATDFKGFAVSDFRGGAWYPLRNVASSVEGDEIVLTVPSGEYLITAGVRNANGDPWIQTCNVRLDPETTTACAWNLDLPEDAGIFAFPKVRELEELPKIQLFSVEGEEPTLEELVSEHPLLFVFFLNYHEPSMRMLPLVANAHEALAEQGVLTCGVCLPAAKDVRHTTTAIEGLPFSVRKGYFGVGESFGLPLTEDGNSFAELPSILLLNRGGKVLLWVEGYDLKIEELLKAAARMVR